MDLILLVFVDIFEGLDSVEDVFLVFFFYGQFGEHGGLFLFELGFGFDEFGELLVQLEVLFLYFASFILKVF